MIGVRKKEDTFFQLFQNSIEHIGSAALFFHELVTDYVDVRRKVEHMKELETECDKEAHKVLEALHASFVTPFDREDIYDIAREMDNIVDSMEEVANRFLVFDVHSMRPEAKAMTEIIVKSVDELKVLFAHLGNMKKDRKVMEQVIEVNRLENEGDLVYRDAMSRLFREEKDPVEIIKWQLIFDLLEESVDACEGVANIIEGVVMKHA
ncbi:MAG: DUF47 domain-containing protein [Firmicutes bacterium]|nr:DUF47 domain-containing protein [Bacillota bacterium]